jgi:hypothetical protein
MGKRFTLITVLVIFGITNGWSQDSTFFKIGASGGINKSWRKYDSGTPGYQNYSGTGFEAGLNIFHKSKRFVGFLADLSFLQTRSSMKSPDLSYSTDIEEISKWVTASGNVIVFPFPRTRKLLFIGTGLQFAHLLTSSGTLKITRHGNPDPDYLLPMKLDSERNHWNYFFDLVTGITLHQFNHHRILLLLTYSKMLGQFSVEKAAPLYPADYLFSDYAINIFTLKLMVAL